MKTRIKIIEKNSGEKIYIPQYKIWVNPIIKLIAFPFQILLMLFVSLFTQELSWAWLSKWQTLQNNFWKTAEQSLVGDSHEDIEASDLTEAQVLIDKFLRIEALKKATAASKQKEKIANKTKRTTYLKYP